jgi:hypothetical protein
MACLLRGSSWALRAKGGAVVLGLAVLLGLSPEARAVSTSCDDGAYVCTDPGPGRLPLAAAGRSATLYADAADFPGVLRAVRDLQADLGRVVRDSVRLRLEALPATGPAVIVGTLGRSALVDRLVREGKVDTSGVAGRWEAFLQQVVDDPFPGVDRALVIAGSDKRGTIFGAYDLVRAMGVSPWTWWADVPVPHRPDLYVVPGRRVEAPVVRYRGLFLNDEEPALGNWVRATYGGFNADFYEDVFELILRLKGNYLWPAMWGKAIANDDPRSPALADEMGVVLGTSHHEPLMRAHVEWERYGSGDWDYRTNADSLRAFWREGIERMGDHESLVTIGMRGDGDEAMTEGTAIDLLERVVADQRAIIEDVTGEPAEATPQVWALYKEVQDYYDQGMEVPGDVTLLFADDNWGNIRRLPEPGAERPGGYGVYYHFDYVGGPRSYKWINVTQIERVWEQMHLAYEHGADRIWIANVGDLKPMEFPISFFLDYAWDPAAWPAERLPAYTRQWAAEQFGEEHAEEIAHLLQTYTRYNSRRTPELLTPETYSLIAYREAERVVADYNALLATAERVGDALPEQYYDAYFQLVLHPIMASANLNELYVTVAKNRLYAEQGRAATNDLAARARVLFERDDEISRIYHEDIAGGKWNHMMAQTNIGYTTWSDPPEDVMPEVETIEVSDDAEMGVAVEGSADWWPEADALAVLPEIDPYDRVPHYFEVFNRGREAFTFTAESGVPWLRVTPAEGRVEDHVRVEIEVDWAQAPEGRHEVPIAVRGPERSVTVQAVVFNPAAQNITGFVEHDGYVSIEAPHYTDAVGQGPIEWQIIPGLGRTDSGVTPVPVTAEPQEPGGDSPHLAYRIYVHEPGEVEVQAYLSPSFDFRGTDGLRYAVSFDDAEPQVLNMHPEGSLSPDTYHPEWNRMVADNVLRSVSTHVLDTPGEHVLKFWMVDPGVVLQKLVVATDELPPSYLGPPESARLSSSSNP